MKKAVFGCGLAGILVLVGCQSGMYSSNVAVSKKDNGVSDYTVVDSLDVKEYSQSMPVVVEYKSTNKKGEHGLNNLLWFFTLGIVPGIMSEETTYDVTVKTPIGEKTGTCKVEASSWMGWLPIFVPYPGIADERTSSPKLPNATLEGKVRDQLVANLVSQFPKSEYVNFVAKNNSPERKAQRAKEEAAERERLAKERAEAERVRLAKEEADRSEKRVAEFELTHTVCPTNAIALYHDKAAKGDPIAQYFMGKALLWGIGCETNASMAYAWAKKSADSGFATGINLLGLCYLNGGGVEKDPLTAYEMFEKAADGGSLLGKRNAGECCLKGDGVAKDEKKGETLIKEAAEGGLVIAMLNMGYLRMGSKEYKKAASWFKMAMEAGSLEGKGMFVVAKSRGSIAKESDAELQKLRNVCDEIVGAGNGAFTRGEIASAYCILAEMAQKDDNLILELDMYERADEFGTYCSRKREIEEELAKKYSKSTILAMKKKLHQNKRQIGVVNGEGKDLAAKQSNQLLSFCGIKFGDELPKTPVFGDQRTKDGKSLMRTVKLQKPFRGMDHATVFASIKTRKICCVQLEWTTEGLGDDAVPEGKSVVEAVLKRFPDAEKIPRDMPDGFMNLHGDEYKVGGGTVSIGWVQSHFMSPPSRLQLTAKNDEFMRLAKEEYEQESGGDGSSVL